MSLLPIKLPSLISLTVLLLVLINFLEECIALLIKVAYELLLITGS